MSNPNPNKAYPHEKIVHAPYPELIVPVRDKHPRERDRKHADEFRIWDTNGSRANEHVGAINLETDTIWVPLTPDGIGVSNHEMGHAMWSPKSVPRTAYPATILMAVEDARINMGLHKLDLDRNPPEFELDRMRAQIQTEVDDERWGDIVLRSVAHLAVPGLKEAMEEAISVMPEMFRDFAAEWSTKIAHELREESDKAGRPVGSFEHVRKLSKTFAAEYMLLMEKAKEELEKEKAKIEDERAAAAAAAASGEGEPGGAAAREEHAPIGSPGGLAAPGRDLVDHGDSGKTIEFDGPGGPTHDIAEFEVPDMPAKPAPPPKDYDEMIREAERRYSTRTALAATRRPSGASTWTGKTPFTKYDSGSKHHHDVEHKLYKARVEHELKQAKAAAREVAARPMARRSMNLGNGGCDHSGTAFLTEPVLTELHQAHKRGRARVPRCSEEGALIRSPHRMLIDQKIFQRKIPREGATVLVDASGSMRLTADMIHQIVTVCGPDTLVAMYAGDDQTGEVRIIAKGMRMADKIELDRDRMGGNIVDAPALEWLCRQKGPRIWISDGLVTGRGENTRPEVYRRCDELQERGRIIRLRDAEELDKWMTLAKQKGGYGEPTLEEVIKSKATVGHYYRK